MIAKITPFLLLTGISLSSAAASPCSGIDQSIDASRKARLAEPIAAQLKTDHVTVVSSMRLKDWSIIFVETSFSDPPFLFFKGDPNKTHYVTLWSGAATIYEGEAIKRWTLQNAPGIPKELASCFAQSVTTGERQ